MISSIQIFHIMEYTPEVQLEIRRAYLAGLECGRAEGRKKSKDEFWRGFRSGYENATRDIERDDYESND